MAIPALLLNQIRQTLRQAGREKPRSSVPRGIEGTIITEYDYSQELADGRFPAIINPALPGLLQQFSDQGWKIVLATGTDGDNLAYYKSQFETAGFAALITAYLPSDHAATDTKVDKLKKYQQQYDLAADAIYFYDDSPKNVDAAQQAGYRHAQQVSNLTAGEGCLAECLKLLADSVKPVEVKEAKKATVVVPPSVRDTQTFFAPPPSETTVLASSQHPPDYIFLSVDKSSADKAEEKTPCCAPCAIL